MKEIPLTRGYVAIVDDSDYADLTQWKWYAHHRKSGAFYAARRRVNGKQGVVKMHRQILGALPGEDVHHANHKTLDNRRSNITRCTRSQHHASRRKRAGCSSQFKGVHWRRDVGCWRAEIQHNGKKHHLGLHDDEREAARAYNVAALDHFGEFALLNEV